jgi:hypothetical protein
MISPYHLADISRKTGIPLWNPDDPSYFLRDGGFGINPYLQDYIRFHIPLSHAMAEKALPGEPQFTPENVASLPTESGPSSGYPQVSSTPGVERMKTGTTPGGMSAALSDPDKVRLAAEIHKTLAIDPDTRQSRLLLPAIGAHRIAFKGPTLGAWEEGGLNHLDPHIAIDVPNNPNDPKFHAHVHGILADLFRQTAIGSEIHRPKSFSPNAMGIRGHWDEPLSEAQATALAMDLVKSGKSHGHGPEVYPGENFARAILYPYTEGQPVSIPTGIGSSNFPSGDVRFEHQDQVAANANEISDILRKHGARETRLFGLQTGYHEPSGPLPADVTGDPKYQAIKNALGEVRARFGVEKGMETASEDDKDAKVAKVMREFKEGKLRSSSGDIVTDRDQAIAIAMSESGQSKG